MIMFSFILYSHRFWIDYFPDSFAFYPHFFLLGSICMWQQCNSNQQTLSLQTNTQPFSQPRQMIELCHEYFSVRCIWLYVAIMSHTSFRVNLYSIVCLIVKELLVRSRRHIQSLSDSTGIQTHTHLVHKRVAVTLKLSLKLVRDMIIAYNQNFRFK